MNIRFLNYIATPEQRYKGVSTVEVDGILLRFKVMEGRDGKGYFVTPFSLKMPDESYVEAFTIDSRIQDLEIKDLIRKNIPSSNSYDEQDIPF